MREADYQDAIPAPSAGGLDYGTRYVYHSEPRTGLGSGNDASAGSHS